MKQKKLGNQSEEGQLRYVYAEKERKALVLSHSRDDVNVNIDMAKQCRGRKGSQRKQVNNNPLCSHEDKYPSVGCIYHTICVRV